jgi:hypothetical protein
MTSVHPPARLEITPSRPGDVRERQRQRAARRQEAIDRKGRDEQRLRRADGHTYLVFPDRATADEVMREIAATPTIADGLAWPVQMWDDDAGAAIGTFEASDGRVAVGHPWTAAERAWLAEYVEGWRTVAIVGALPADWQPKGENEAAKTRG